MSTPRHSVTFYLPGTGLEGIQDTENAVTLPLTDDELTGLRDHIEFGRWFWRFHTQYINLHQCSFIDGVPEA